MILPRLCPADVTQEDLRSSGPRDVGALLQRRHRSSKLLIEDQRSAE
jgi:hypothetical protein